VAGRWPAGARSPFDVDSDLPKTSRAAFSTIGPSITCLPWA
jgi:hypothetical protein